MATVSMAMAIILRSRILPISEILLAGALSTAVAAEPALFESRQLTPSGEYTFGIEGPAVDATGTLYVVNHQKQGTIGKLSPGAPKSELFVELPAGSIGNSIRFDRDGRMFVGDYKNHNVFVFERGQKELRTYFHSDRFNQPNDLTVAADGTIYASDPHWRRRDGQIWRITRGPDGEGRGEVMSSDRKMGTTNGIDVSPDEKILYVGESETREIWAYRLEGARLVAPRLVKKFSDFSLDGLRTDIDGKLFVTRILKGTVAVLSPNGIVEREILLRAKEPTNLAFGGPDGKTIFVTQRQGGFIEAFRVDRPGREYCLQKTDTSDTPCQVPVAAPTSKQLEQLHRNSK
jgi:sugar lactone lactonase YvrE